MSNSLRDMLVGIYFDDGASKPLDKIESKMDGLESGFIRFGTKVDKSGTGLQIMGKFGLKATNQVSDGFRKSERELTDFTDGVDDSHKGLKKIGTEGDKATDELERGFNRSEKEAKDFNREVKNSSNVLGGIKRAAMGLGGIIAGAFAVDKIKDFAVSGIELAAGKQALNSQFGQVFGGMETTASSSLKNIADSTGIVSDRLKGSFTQIAAFAKTTGADTESALKLTERATLAAADNAAFADRSIEDVTENLRSLLKGNFENDAALGISVTETTRNAIAMEKFNKKFKDLNELQKQDALLSMVEDSHKVTGALGQAARESKGYENVIGNLNSVWDGLKATMMTPFLEPLTNGLVALNEQIQGIDAERMGLKMKAGFDTAMDVVVPTFNAIKDGIGYIQENKEPLIAGLAGITAGFVSLKVISTVSGMMTLYQGSAFAATVATHGFNAALRANPIGLVVTGIGLLVAGGVALYRNWDTVKLKAGELWATAKEKFAGIKSSVSDFVQPAIIWFDNLSTKWSNFKASLSNFKMPGWVSSIGGAISGAASKLSGFVNGSHATGLASVPHDGYVAELHKGEPVLTAAQGDTLRSAGILSANSDGTPNLNLDALKGRPKQPDSAVATVDSVGTPVINNSTGNNIQISVPIELIVQGNSDNAAIQKLLSSLDSKVREVFESIFREKLAGMEG